MYTFILFLCFMGSYLLFTNGRKSEGGNLYLAFLFLFTGIQSLSHIKIIEEIEIHIASIFFINTASISFLIGPAFYFYIISLINPAFKLERKHLVHLVPFLIFFIDTLPYIFSSYSSKIQLINTIKINPIQILDIPLLIGKSNVYYIARPTVLLVYLYMSTRFFQANKFLLKNYYSTFQTNILKRWVQMIIIFSAIVYFSNLIFTIHNYFTRDIDGLIIMTRLAAISLVFLCIQLFVNPYVLYGFTEVKYFSSKSLIATLYLVKENTIFTPEWIDDLCEKFAEIDKNKSYLQQGYTIKHLKEELQISNKSITYYFSEIAKNSFSEWKNKKRTEHAIKLIDEGYLRKYTREQLANECGFLSRSNFNQALKNYSTRK